MDRRDYLQIGKLKLPVIGGLRAFDGSRGHDFATYSLASGKPTIKPVGSKLDTISIAVMLRAFLGDDIVDTINIIDSMIESGEPQNLIFINGLYKGKYVITQIRDKIQKTLPTGELIKYDFTLDMTEYVDRNVLSVLVQSNASHKSTQEGTIGHRDKTTEMNNSIPSDTKLVE